MRTMLALILLWTATPVAAERIMVAVASNFSAAMEALVEEFENGGNHEVVLVFGSSGRFYAQIVNGAPYDLFFSADQAKPIALEQAGLAVPGSRFTYATGSLVLWSGDPQLIDPEAEVLRGNGFNKLAMANPRVAPYGVAAAEVLDALNLSGALQGRIVLGENIAQTWQFVSSGNAELGFVALSQIIHEETTGRGSAWPVPASLHTPIRQDAVLLQRARDSRAAGALLAWVRSAAGRRMIHSFGYQVEED